MTNERRGQPKVEKRETGKNHLSDKVADLFLGGWENFDYDRYYNKKKR